MDGINPIGKNNNEDMFLGKKIAQTTSKGEEGLAEAIFQSKLHPGTEIITKQEDGSYSVHEIVQDSGKAISKKDNLTFDNAALAKKGLELTKVSFVEYDLSEKEKVPLKEIDKLKDGNFSNIIGKNHNEDVYLGKKLGQTTGKGEKGLAEAQLICQFHNNSVAIFKEEDNSYSVYEIGQDSRTGVYENNLTIDKTALAKKGLEFVKVPTVDFLMPEEEQVELANANDTPVETLEALAQSEYLWVRQAVAENKNTPEETLKILAQDNEPDVRKVVADNPHTPVETLNILATDENSDVRSRVAENKNTPVETLKILANDPDWSVKFGVVNNKNTSVETLKILANDDDVNLKIAVAENIRTPVETLKMLANDPAPNVKKSVAQNNSTPVEILKILANDHEWFAREGVASNKNTPAETLKILADDTISNVRYAVAENNSTPAEILKILAKDNDSYVRDAVARNKNTPKETLKILTHDKDENIRDAAKDNLHPGRFKLSDLF